MCTHTRTCRPTSTCTVHKVRGLRVRPFSIDRSHFKVFTRVFSYSVMRGEFSRRSVKKTGAEVFSDDIAIRYA